MSKRTYRTIKLPPLKSKISIEDVRMAVRMINEKRKKER